MERKHVKSSNVNSIGFDNGMMEVEFSNGTLYQYPDVDPQDYRDLIESDSIGKAFHKLIRGKYKGSKVEQKKEQEA